MFAKARILHRVKSGELHEKVTWQSHPAAPKAGEPFCTRSQTVSYFNSNGQRIALVHQYRRPDGSIGASGRPDPKSLLLDGVLYEI